MVKMNRKQRRAAASAKGRKKMSKDKEAQKTMSQEDQLERLNKMLSGKIKPPSDMVAYFVDQMRKISSESDLIRKNLQQHRDSVVQLEARGREMQGAQKKCVEDIRHWDSLALEEAAKAKALEPELKVRMVSKDELPPDVLESLKKPDEDEESEDQMPPLGGMEVKALSAQPES